jgi:restriction system protein
VRGGDGGRYGEPTRARSRKRRTRPRGAYGGDWSSPTRNKGVFITTSTFSQQAIDFAGSVERVVLVDGSKLAALMIEHEVGVASRAVKVPKIDSDYFDE